MINYLFEHFTLYGICAFFTLLGFVKSWIFNLIIEVAKELMVSCIVDHIKDNFKKKGN
jgi:hypothetical protein